MLHRNLSVDALINRCIGIVLNTRGGGWYHLHLPTKFYSALALSDVFNDPSFSLQCQDNLEQGAQSRLVRTISSSESQGELRVPAFHPLALWT